MRAIDIYVKSLNIYLEQAKECGKAKLYLAGIIMYGAALEAILAAYLIASCENEFSMADLRSMTLENLIDYLNAQKCIPDKVHQLRKLRNLIHPYQVFYHSKENKKLFEVVESDYRAVEELWQNVISSLLKNL